MPQSIFDLITAGAIASYHEELASNRIPYLGEALFPANKRLGLKLEWIKGYDSLPIALQPSAFDAQPLLRDRGGVQKESTRMPFFREAMRLGEQDRQDLLQFSAIPNSPYAQEIINRLFDDVSGLVDGALIIPEVMRMSLLTSGAFTISSEADSGQFVSYDYNYDPDGTWATKNTTNIADVDKKWSNHEKSNPVEDLLAIKAAAKRRGIELGRVVMGYETFLDIYANEKIRLAMYPTYGVAANVFVREDAVKEYVEGYTGLKIQVYDKLYKSQDGTEQFFYPTSGQVTLLPKQALGTTWYGTTPEEADLRSGRTDADVRVVHTGIAIGSKMESLPVNVINWVSSIVLPSFEQMDRVFNLTY